MTSLAGPIAALVLFGSYANELHTQALIHSAGSPLSVLTFDLSSAWVIAGLLIGGLMPFLFASLAMQAVGRVGGEVVEEVRRQFREHPGIMDYSEKPEYGRVVDICTGTAQKELIKLNEWCAVGFASMVTVLPPCATFIEPVGVQVPVAGSCPWQPAGRRSRAVVLCGLAGAVHGADRNLVVLTEECCPEGLATKASVSTRFRPRPSCGTRSPSPTLSALLLQSRAQSLKLKA